MSTKERIVQFIEKQGISNRKFCEKISVSPNIFSTKSSIGSDILIKINNEYPELNMDWVITGRGAMMFKEQPDFSYVNDEAPGLITAKDALIETLQKQVQDKERIITMLEAQLGEKKSTRVT